MCPALLTEDRILSIGIVCSLSLSSSHTLLLLLSPHTPCFPQPTCFWLLLKTRPPGLASCCFSGPWASASLSALDSALAHVAFAICLPCLLAGPQAERETSLIKLGVSAGGRSFPGAAIPLRRGMLTVLCFPASTQHSTDSEDSCTAILQRISLANLGLCNILDHSGRIRG